MTTPTCEFHQSVLLAETVALLAPAPGAIFVDGTLGGGGHSEAFLMAGARVIGLDRDPEALAFAGERLKRFGEQFTGVRANFADAGAVLDGLGVEGIDGALLDIGVSSRQLDAAGRGFSFQADGPLDMRMDPDGGVTAADVVNGASEEELARIFREYGEEGNARRIAREIVRNRTDGTYGTDGKFVTTLDLARCVEKINPRRSRTHPATKVFQALRIAVNGELEALERALPVFSERLNAGGRFGVLTFHSLEDRMVKKFFKDRATEWLDRPEWPERRRNPQFQFRLVTGKPVVAGEEESVRNPRSRSAKLRVVERISL